MVVRVRPAYWERDDAVSRTLAPLGWLWCGLAMLRRMAYRARLRPSGAAGVPVIVVGNLTVGGTGKTPFTIWLVEALRQAGYAPGVVSRGYGGQAASWPQQVRPDSDPVVVGDEALLIARRTQRPMAVGPDRLEAARELVRHAEVDVVVTDDGLQHYRLQRDIEIEILDGRRRYGNGRCLPAGPLREPLGRRRSVDFRVCNGTPLSEDERGMRLAVGDPVNLITGESCPAAELGPEVHAVAGIGDPERFFVTVRRQGLRVIPHAFPDHHDYEPGDVDFPGSQPVLMTEKDAMKHARAGEPRHWFLPVTAEPEPGLAEAIVNRLEAKHHG
ncbi:lipid-A-disaccharide kinase [Thiohalospira halophila DSM 15071]|uniref:Tetraacyldisaccharide 4'-kinase n=1 Tax=Thiohalospira halophila DSM 15071 TaxID=1123397 RepID=A0A1I1P7C1_9GAMM|nr:lipid-A-disaccharide kinase [Thiohalospira halophila DSM 15071]